MKKKQTTQNFLTPENYIRHKSKTLPIYKCFILEGWEELRMGMVVIERKHVTGNITACLYLVDLNCLGVKDTMFRFNEPAEEVDELIKKYADEEGATMVEIPYELAHNIILAGIEYAEQYGFKPHKDYTSITSNFLEEDTDDIPLIDIECGGKDGKPYYENRGFETAAQERKIVAQLEKTAGKGNFEYASKYDEDEDDEDDDEDNYQGILAELEKLDKEEQIKLYVKLIGNDDEKNPMSSKDLEYVRVLIDLLSVDLVTSEQVEEQLAMMTQKFKFETIEDDQLPSSLFTGLQSEDSGDALAYIYSVLDDSPRDKNGQKNVVALQKEVGDIPVVAFAELYYLRPKKKEKYLDKLREYSQKYPDYFLIEILREMDLPQSESSTCERLDQLLARTNYPLTDSEIDFYFSNYTFYLITNEQVALPAIFAYEQYLNDCDLILEGTFTKALTLTKIGRMRRLNDHLVQTGYIK